MTPVGNLLNKITCRKQSTCLPTYYMFYKVPVYLPITCSYHIMLQVFLYIEFIKQLLFYICWNFYIPPLQQTNQSMHFNSALVLIRFFIFST